MKALAINGSARKDGNTADMLNTVLSELEEAGFDTEQIQLADNVVNPCKACFTCTGKKNCVFTGDLFQELFRKMTEADVIIIGSPSYSADVSSTLKAVIDRASVISDTNTGLFRYKLGAAVAVARRAGTISVLNTINNFFLNKEMFVAGSSYWNIAYGRVPGEVMKDAEGVATMRNLGKNIVWFFENIKKQKI